MTPTTKAIVALLAFASLYLALQVLRWAARVWGVEAVGVFLALPVLAIPAVALWDLRVERKWDKRVRCELCKGARS